MKFDLEKRAIDLCAAVFNPNRDEEIPSPSLIDAMRWIAHEAADARAEEIAQGCERQARVRWCDPGKAPTEDWWSARRTTLKEAAAIARATITEKPEGATPLSSNADVRGCDTLSDASPSGQQRPPALSQSEQDARALEEAERVLIRRGYYYANRRVCVTLRCRASDIRAQAEPDVWRNFFEAACAASNGNESWNVGQLARAWFGPLVGVLEKIASVGPREAHTATLAREALEYLRERARKVKP